MFVKVLSIAVAITAGVVNAAPAGLKTVEDVLWSYEGRAGVALTGEVLNKTLTTEAGLAARTVAGRQVGNYAPQVLGYARQIAAKIEATPGLAAKVAGLDWARIAELEVMYRVPTNAIVESTIALAESGQLTEANLTNALTAASGKITNRLPSFYQELAKTPAKLFQALAAGYSHLAGALSAPARAAAAAMMVIVVTEALPNCAQAGDSVQQCFVDGMESIDRYAQAGGLDMASGETPNAVGFVDDVANAFKGKEEEANRATPGLYLGGLAGTMTNLAPKIEVAAEAGALEGKEIGIGTEVPGLTPSEDHMRLCVIGRKK